MRPCCLGANVTVMCTNEKGADEVTSVFSRTFALGARANKQNTRCTSAWSMGSNLSVIAAGCLEAWKRCESRSRRCKPGERW